MRHSLGVPTLVIVIASGCWIALGAHAQEGGSGEGDPAARSLTSGIDSSNFDPSVRPQDDLFRAVNGAWLKRTQIPADRSTYGAFVRVRFSCR